MKKLQPKEKAEELLKKHGIQDAMINLLQIKELVVEEKDRNYWEMVGVYLKIIQEQEEERKKNKPIDWSLS